MKIPDWVNVLLRAVGRWFWRGRVTRPRGVIVLDVYAPGDSSVGIPSDWDRVTICFEREPADLDWLHAVADNVAELVAEAYDGATATVRTCTIYPNGR